MGVAKQQSNIEGRIKVMKEQVEGAFFASSEATGENEPAFQAKSSPAPRTASAIGEHNVSEYERMPPETSGTTQVN